MRLKQITLVGFKSFPDRTDIPFVAGVSAVVGPNGCGKSNIADAIRWVMGEQSARSLRGREMADLIFNGEAAPQVTIKLTMADWVAMQKGEETGQALFMSGRMQAQGDMVFLMALQALLRNPLAEPYILGVSSGAGVGVLLGMALPVWAPMPGWATRRCWRSSARWPPACWSTPWPSAAASWTRTR